MPIFEIRTEQPLSRPSRLLVPVAPDTREQRVTSVEFIDCEPRGELAPQDGAQHAHVIDAPAGTTPRVRFHFEEPGPGLAASAFVPLDTRFDRASEELAAELAEGVGKGPLAVRIPALMQFIADRFTYGNRPRNLGDDLDAMPALGCELATGNCVDMHTLAVAALRAIGARAAYVIGGFVPAGADEYLTGHCWLNLDADGASHHFDISHHVEYGLGPVTTALNPEPGRRFALGIGRGLRYAGEDGEVELPSLSGFHVLEGADRGTKLRTVGRFA